MQTVDTHTHERAQNILHSTQEESERKEKITTQKVNVYTGM